MLPRMWSLFPKAPRKNAIMLVLNNVSPPHTPISTSSHFLEFLPLPMVLSPGHHQHHLGNISKCKFPVTKPCCIHTSARASQGIWLFY